MDRAKKQLLFVESEFHFRVPEFLPSLPTFGSPKEFTVCHLYWFILNNESAIFVNLFEISDWEIWQLYTCINCSPFSSFKSLHILDMGCNIRASVIISRSHLLLSCPLEHNLTNDITQNRMCVWNSASELWAGANYIISTWCLCDRASPVQRCKQPTRCNNFIVY